MKTPNKLIILLLLSTTSAFGQWSEVYNNQGVNAACFARSKDSCIVAGNDGKLYRTVNGGTSWDSVQTVFKTSWFHDIEFPSKDIGYACGGTAFGNHKSVIAKTTNGGLTWDSIASDIQGYSLYAAHFINDNIGFFGGDAHILKTIDGGQTFSVQMLPLAAIYDFFFISSNTGFFTSTSQIRRTTDQGQTWSVVYTDTTFINAIWFTSNTTGFAVCNEGGLLKTTDGGNTWSKTLITNDTIFLRDIQFVTSTTGYIAASWYQVADQGYLYKTTDGGNTWIQQLTTNVPLSGISMSNMGQGYAGGYRKVFRINQPLSTTANPNYSTDPPFQIYPSPSPDILTIKYSEALHGGSVHIHDAKGIMVREILVENASDIAVDALTNGFYTVTFLDKQGGVAAVQKVIITR